MRHSLAIAVLFAASLQPVPSPAGVAEILVRPAELAGGWESISEAPIVAAEDPDLQRWGVSERETRHYTRHRGRHVEVCSVEIWAFVSEAQARTALEGFAYPNWAIEREGSLLVMLHGRRFDVGETPRLDVSSACREIGRLVRLRASRLLEK